MGAPRAHNRSTPNAKRGATREVEPVAKPGRITSMTRAHETTDENLWLCVTTTPPLEGAFVRVTMR